MCKKWTNLYLRNQLFEEEQKKFCQFNPLQTTFLIELILQPFQRFFIVHFQ